ncbi:ribosome maturation factor RimM [Rickettsiales bacterium LUAb2]
MNKIIIADISGVKGLKGEVKLKSYGADLLSVLDYNLYSSEGMEFIITNAYIHKNTVIAKIEGINTVEEAQKLVGTSLYINREELPQLEDNNYYLVDLIGLKIFNQEKQEIGKVIAVHNFGANDIIEVNLQQKSVMLPFSKEIFIEVNINDGYLSINESLASEYS